MIDEDRQRRKMFRHALMYGMGKEKLKEMQLIVDLIDAGDKELCDRLQIEFIRKHGSNIDWTKLKEKKENSDEQLPNNQTPSGGD